MPGGMRFDNDDIRALPLHVQEQVGVAIANQMAQANPVAGREEKTMLKCDPRAFARCPYKGSCGSIEDAVFPEGSDCDIFNKKKLSAAVTNADHIRGMSDMELATFLYTVTRACADHNCAQCPMGPDHCTVLLHWLKTPEMEGV